MALQTQDFVSVQNVSNRYMQRRQLLKGAANAGLLWALGVGAVIGGEFFGWNFGLAAGGFNGMLIATLMMAAMYICIAYCASELSSAFPHAGGFFSFTRNAFGPMWGYICGITLLIEYILAVSTLVVGVGTYLQPLLPSLPDYVIWLFTYLIFTGINILGVGPTLIVSLYLCVTAILVLAVFCGTAVFTGIFNVDLLFNIVPDPGQTVMFPKGWQGIFAAIPFAIWFYLAIEQLPMAAEETQDVPKNMPRGMLAGVFTLIVLSLLVLVLNSGVGGGAAAMGLSNVPLGDGLKEYFNAGAATNVALLCGLVSTVHSITYACGRIVFSMARAGYLPRWMSQTNQSKTPAKALIVSAIIGFICTLVIGLSGKSTAGSILLNMSVFGAVLSYIFLMLSYMKLKSGRSPLTAPYQSPLGMNGAMVGLLLALVSLTACFLNPDYRPGLMGVGLVVFVALIYFWLHSRHHLVAQAPEELSSLEGV